jgi:hypothetical protein
VQIVVVFLLNAEKVIRIRNVQIALGKNAVAGMQFILNLDTESKRLNMF